MNKIAFAVLLLALSLAIAAFAGEPDPLREEAQLLSALLLMTASGFAGLAVYRRRPRTVYN